MSKYDDIEVWLSDCRKLVENDWDNGMLFTGPVGSGKSTFLVQVLRQLDPALDVERIHFTIPDALNQAPQTPRYGAWALDEAHVSGRKAMHGEMQRLNDYNQVSRGLNHHWGLCFHQDKRVDKPIMERVRWNLHIPRRGIVQLRVLKKNYLQQPQQPWRVVAAWRFRENSGPLWRRYLKKKHDHMLRMSRTTTSPAGEAEALGFDPEALDREIEATLALL